MDNRCMVAPQWQVVGVESHHEWSVTSHTESESYHSKVPHFLPGGSVLHVCVPLLLAVVGEGTL